MTNLAKVSLACEVYDAKDYQESAADTGLAGASVSYSRRDVRDPKPNWTCLAYGVRSRQHDRQ